MAAWFKKCQRGELFFLHGSWVWECQVLGLGISLGIATGMSRDQRDLTRPGPPNGGFSKGDPRLFQGNLGWWNIIFWPEEVLFGKCLANARHAFDKKWAHANHRSRDFWGISGSWELGDSILDLFYFPLIFWRSRFQPLIERVTVFTHHPKKVTFSLRIAR